MQGIDRYKIEISEISEISEQTTKQNRNAELEQRKKFSWMSLRKLETNTREQNKQDYETLMCGKQMWIRYN